jgi:hypothetical protein
VKTREWMLNLKRIHSTNEFVVNKLGIVEMVEHNASELTNVPSYSISAV